MSSNVNFAAVTAGIVTWIAIFYFKNLFIAIGICLSVFAVSLVFNIFIDWLVKKVIQEKCNND